MTSLFENSVLERAALLITESSKFHGASYLRKVPTITIHLFSLVSILQLVVLIIIGFYAGPYAKLVFPFIVAAMLPIRHILLPKVLNPRGEWNEKEKKKSYLEYLDPADH